RRREEGCTVATDRVPSNAAAPGRVGCCRLGQTTDAGSPRTQGGRTEMSAVATSRSHRHLLTPWSKQAGISTPTITRAEGSYLYDDEGKRYLDLSAGLVAVNLGHGHPAVTQAIKEQLDKVAYVAPSLMNDTRSEFAELLSDISPWSIGSRVFFTTNGGEANEDALKMSRMLTGRHKVLAAYRSFHGSAPGAGSLTGEDRRWA